MSEDEGHAAQDVLQSRLDEKYYALDQRDGEGSFGIEFQDLTTTVDVDVSKLPPKVQLRSRFGSCPSVATGSSQKSSTVFNRTLTFS